MSIIYSGHLLILLLAALTTNPQIAEPMAITNLNGGILQALADEKSDLVFAVLENSTGSSTLVAFSLTNGNAVFKIPSASCPSFSSERSLFVYWDEISRSAIVNRMENYSLDKLFELPSDSQPCPLISKDGNILVLDRGFGNGYDDDGYDVYAYNISSTSPVSRINSSSIPVKSDSGCVEECHLDSLELNKDGSKVLLNVAIENENTFANELYFGNINGTVTKLKTLFSPLANFETYVPSGSLSSNGSLLTFHNFDSTDNEVYLFNLLNKKLSKITNNRDVNDHSPVISEDGSKVVFWSGNDIKATTTKNADKFTTKTLVRDLSFPSESFYSPILKIGSNLILYSTNQEKNNSIIILNLTG